MTETLWDQLRQALPKVLPKDADEAASGNDLIAKLKSDKLLDGDFTDNSIRQYLSWMSADAASPVAKRAGKQGYFLRAQEEDQPEASVSGAVVDDGQVSPQSEGTLGVPQDDATELAKRNMQLEEKFRAFFMRHQELENRFPMHVEHTRAKKAGRGMHEWKFPDVVVVQWEAGKESNDGYRLDPELLRVRESLGDQPFHLTSVELKVGVTTSNFRQLFFQCVSNSRWAHKAVLAIAMAIPDDTLQAELRRLGASYDIAVLTYSLDATTLNDLPSADKILEKDIAEFEDLYIESKAEVKHIATGRDREGLDWDHLADLRNITREFVELFEWLATCLDKRVAYPLKGYRELKASKKTVEGIESRYSGWKDPSIPE
jgi:hypothetical protein